MATCATSASKLSSATTRVTKIVDHAAARQFFKLPEDESRVRIEIAWLVALSEEVRDPGRQIPRAMFSGELTKPSGRCYGAYDGDTLVGVARMLAVPETGAVAIFGAGPVGLMAAASARLLGAERIDETARAEPAHALDLGKQTHGQ